MKRALYIGICGILMLMAWGCSNNRGDTSDMLVRIGSHTLSRDELNAEMPTGLTPEQKEQFAQRYIDEWISQVLLYDVARKNLDNVEHLDKLVEEYRRDLFVYEYRRRLSDERMETTFPEDTIRSYYEQYSDRFTLHKPIVKGLMVKVPRNAPQMSSLRSWVTTESQNAVEHIEKYAVKNAIGYDYFYDQWVWFDDVKDNIPYDFGNDANFLRLNKNLDVTQNDVVYLLHISEYRLVGATMPYEFARPRIIEILKNSSRIDFNKELEKEVYRQAESDGRIERFYTDSTLVTQ